MTTKLPGARSSPFKTKGVLFQGTLAFFDENCPGGSKALVDAALDDPELHAFLSQRFLVGGSYEALVIPDLIELEARVMRLDMWTYLERRTRWQALRDTSGVYRVLLKLASPESVIVRLPRVMTQMFNFGKPSTEAIAPRRYLTEISGVPSALRFWLETVITVYAETTLLAAGAKHPMLRVLPNRPLPPQDGHPMMVLRAEATWDP